MSPQVFLAARIPADEGPALSSAGTAPVPWWSFTKTALAACALRLAAAGVLALDAPMAGRPYTLRQLLQHRAGVPNYGMLAAYREAVARGDAPWPVEELLDRVAADRLLFAPGAGWAYSNVGYFYIRQAIEAAAACDIGAALRRHLFDPLGLASVRLAVTPQDLAATAWGNERHYHPGWVYHGLLVGSPADAARFLHRLLKGDLLSPESLAAMTGRHPVEAVVTGRPWATTGYGLGLMIGEIASTGLAIGHSGAGPGSVGAVYHFPAVAAPCTVAAFMPGENEGHAEWKAAAIALDHSAIARR